MGSGGLKWSEPSLEQSDEALILEVIESANYGDYVRMRVSLREGRVKLTVPWKTKTAQLLEFMRGCCRWIRKNLDRQRQTMMQQANARSAYGAKIRPGGWVYLEGTRFALQPADVQSVEIDKSSSGQEPLLLMPSFSALPEPLAHKLQATFVSRFLKRRLCEIIFSPLSLSSRRPKPLGARAMQRASCGFPGLWRVCRSSILTMCSCMSLLTWRI